MKKIIQLLLISLFLFASCIGENMEDCPPGPAMRHVFFKHHCLYDTDEDFDRWIGNDVVLYIFQDKKLKLKETVPYERIRNGKPYSFKKRFDGEIDVAAWAVPAGSQTAIPQYLYDEFYSDKFVQHDPRGGVYDPFPADLYLGIDSIRNDILTLESTHTIYMVSCACLVNVTIIDSQGAMQSSDDNYLLISGVMDKMNLQYDSFGDQVIVRDEIINENPQLWKGTFGLLPSADDQKLNFTLYGGSKPLAIISTELQARPGGKIDLTIDLRVSVSITVDNAGWDIYPVNVEWM